jgi:hypothetical protein
MTRFEYINNNLQTVKEETKMGFIPISILRHYAIYCRYDAYRKQNNNVTTSVFYTSEDFNISEMTVHRIIKSMNL